MRTFHDIRRRLIVALVASTIVFALSLHVSWRSSGRELSSQQSFTRHEVRRVMEAVELYETTFRKLPLSLSDLSMVEPNFFQDELKAQIIDGWRQPLHFECDGTEWQVISFGRDGKPGGVGLDGDISNRNCNTREVWPTFREFLFELPTRPVVVIALVTAVLAFILSLLTVRVPDFDIPGLLVLAVWLAMMAIGCAVVSAFMVMADVVSGH